MASVIVTGWDGIDHPHVMGRGSVTPTSPTQGAATIPPVPPAGVPRSTRVVPAERNPTWNEVTWHGDSQQWHRDTRATLLTAVTCPADTSVAAGHASPASLSQPGPAPPALGPASTPGVSGTHGWAPQGAVPRVAVLTIPVPCRDLGATTVPLGRLAEEPGLPLALSHLPLLDPRGRPTGATVTVRCSYVPRGQVAAGDTVPHQQGWVAPRLSPPCLSPAVGTAIGVPPGPPRHHAKPAAGRKEDFQVGHPRVRWHPGRCPKQWPPCPHVSRRCG